LEIFEDHRDQRPRRVSIIVSLYNAAAKLPTFWRMLQQQSVLRAGDAEVILVDSGSPSNEYAVFRQLYARDPLPVVYARSKNRETIQTAWNRGIKLSSGAYLAFLGVDEGAHPDCFTILAEELDRDPAIDWVMADSIVTEVDRAGIFKRDVMPYDRTGYRHDWHYLDCTFLSYVGGLYRRNIHDRFGYYDESFRAAGDTEFKNRILPFIKSKYVPRPLGVFNNYPEERTTQHPRAEIEDLRAWYLHRTPAGASYAFGDRPVEDVVALLNDTLGYRKCYCAHTSTDIELADSLSSHLAGRADASRYRGAHDTARQILQLFRGLELLRQPRQTRFPEFAVVGSYRRVRHLSGSNTPRQSAPRSWAWSDATAVTPVGLAMPSASFQRSIRRGDGAFRGVAGRYLASAGLASRTEGQADQVGGCRAASNGHRMTRAAFLGRDGALNKVILRNGKPLSPTPSPRWRSSATPQRHWLDCASTASGSSSQRTSRTSRAAG
jgi:glycosyltransferase involved in cell wall biosynthesis